MIDETKYPKNVLRILKSLSENEKDLEDLLYQWDERCGIRHFEGEQPIEEAERDALVEIMKRRGVMIEPLIESP